MMLWLLIAILLIGGGAAIVNDAAYDGRLFDSGMVVSVAALSALTVYLGRGLLGGAGRGAWLQHALIWAAIALTVALAYRLLPLITGR
ncbi:conserved hypothetical protein [Rhodopseudomonas palustris HaA2]|uniref:Uncharacterized protein n=1 Tax=Rhodopseudomonas palustris (strain HaA2) TaxID=316058 RepID=Q2J0G4_RHOP2|nr:hypothetical protein [Rhodopseudomonas palustris]ABD06046.1 conserved hypothetical protein [Rhodopseudomonas palustris HaA2]